MATAAMFPLGSVLFPHMPLALRLFEPRYLVMLGRLLEGERPEFGVVLIERGHEVGGGDERFDIGTMARIVQVESHADHMSLVAVGTDRVRVRQWLPDGPYPRAEVEALARWQWTGSLAPRRTQVEAEVRAALRHSAGPAPWPADIELADDPVASCWQLAGLAPLGPLDQVALLRSRSPEELLERMSRLTAEAVEVLAADWGDPPASGGGVGRPEDR